MRSGAWSQLMSIFPWFLIVVAGVILYLVLSGSQSRALGVLRQAHRNGKVDHGSNTESFRCGFRFRRRGGLGAGLGSAKCYVNNDRIVLEGWFPGSLIFRRDRSELVVESGHADGLVLRADNRELSLWPVSMSSAQAIFRARGWLEVGERSDPSSDRPSG